jgi:hypothetical protein
MNHQGYTKVNEGRTGGVVIMRSGIHVSYRINPADQTNIITRLNFGYFRINFTSSRRLRSSLLTTSKRHTFLNHLRRSVSQQST